MLGVRPYAETDWDTWWRWEIFRRQANPLDFRRWKAESSRELRQLPCGLDRRGGAPRILDSTCGMGYHAMIQHELGFRVEACDVNPRVLTAAKRLMDQEGMEIPTFQARWEQLGVKPTRYDLVWNDELHQVQGQKEMAAVLRGIWAALRPGGALVFFFADAQKPADGANQASYDWENHPHEYIAWEADVQPTRVILTVLRERIDEVSIAEHNVYLICDRGEPARVESLTMVRSFRWDWAHLTPVLRAVGFSRVESHRFTNVFGRTYCLNVATK